MIRCPDCGGPGVQGLETVWCAENPCPAKKLVRGATMVDAETGAVIGSITDWWTEAIPGRVARESTITVWAYWLDAESEE